MGYTPGDTDLAWSRITPWRALLTSALDQPPFEPITAAVVTGPADSAGVDLLAGWLHAQLRVPVRRRAGSFEVRLDREGGPLTLEFDQNSTAVLVRPGQPDGRVAIRRRDVAGCLAEELRRLDDDAVYYTALGGVPGVDRSEMP
ncbi:hypothetical protein MTP03_28470 [Tsukamurella sp. PLM1]|nr:hypothetical protein MTP03_28470 [Tsukamurella sp. PLM1]